MKKVAKGIAIFQIIFILFITTTICCYAAEETTKVETSANTTVTESVTQTTKQTETNSNSTEATTEPKEERPKVTLEMANKTKAIVTNNIGSSSLEITYTGYKYGIFVENDSSESIAGVKLVITVDDNTMEIKQKSKLKPFETTFFDLTDCFDEGYLEGKEVEISVQNCFSWGEIAVCIAVLLFFIGFIVFLAWLGLC